MLQTRNTQMWRMSAIKGCAVIIIPAVNTEKAGNDDFANVGVTCD
jgi:hypothetical protein